jgi:hypothetical protein
MIIKRNSGLEVEIILSLRYYFNNEREMKTLHAELLNVELRNIINCYSPNKWATTFRLVIDNLELVNVKASLFVDIHDRLGIRSDDFDFFLGITSAYQTGGFIVPKQVTELIRALGGTVEMSYVTYDLEDEVDG